MERFIAKYILVVFFVVGAGVDRSEAVPSCAPSALTSLEKLAPEGYRIYSQLTDKNQFLVWLKCDDMQLDVATAVHESVHTLTEEFDAYPLINGSILSRVHEASAFNAPSTVQSELESVFGKNDLFIKTYLDKEGSSSSADDFMYLLDELNAYSHDLNVAIKLNSLRPTTSHVNYREGLAAMMAFTAAYLKNARNSEELTWRGLQSPQVSRQINAIWTQAEETISKSCRIVDFGMDGEKYLEFVCVPGNNSALSIILKRAPYCCR